MKIACISCQDFFNNVFEIFKYILIYFHISEVNLNKKTKNEIFIHYIIINII